MTLPCDRNGSAGPPAGVTPPPGADAAARYPAHVITRSALTRRAEAARTRSASSGRSSGGRYTNSIANPPPLHPESARPAPPASRDRAPKRRLSSLARTTKPLPSSTAVGHDELLVRAEDIFGRHDLVARGTGIFRRGDLLDTLSTADFDTPTYTGLVLPSVHPTIRNPINVSRYLVPVIGELGQAILEGICRKVDTQFEPPKCLQSNSIVLFSLVESGEADDDSAILHYLPICPAITGDWGEIIHKDSLLTIPHENRERIDNAPLRSTSSIVQWPNESVPIEIFGLVSAYLSRDDIKSMRLVNKEFEDKVSCTLFNTSVVPFNTELYDMVEEDAKTVNRGPWNFAKSNGKGKGKGKGKAKSEDRAEPGTDATVGGLPWQNAKDDSEGKVYRGHGLKVFQGFGPHIQRFGISFEVAEAQLARPPIKHELDNVNSYHGSYAWPPPQYTRFANLAGLEQTADETSRMRAAFANLTKVQDLGLCIDSGLGWLNGPDKSVFHRFFERPSPVFGQSRNVPDKQMQDAQDLWEALRIGKHRDGSGNRVKEISLAHHKIKKSPQEIPGLKDTVYDDVRLWPSISANMLNHALLKSLISADVPFGALSTTCSELDASVPPFGHQSFLVPADIRKEQSEWLLETEWAQRAFLECYMLAIIDNPVAFQNVKRLNIAKLSSGFLSTLARESFWDAMTGLQDVKIHVKPDWRTVVKDDAGISVTKYQNPTQAVNEFHDSVLRDQICIRPSITKLNVGWVGGGEHAEGLFARNSHLMPAPITQLEHSLAASNPSTIVFDFVEHLTLTNCWISPPTLLGFTKNHSDRNLKTLVLDSVSLTAHPRFQDAAVALHAAAAIPQPTNHGPHLPAAINPQAAQSANNPAINLNGAGNPVPGAPFAHVAQVPGGAPNNINVAPPRWTDDHREASWPDIIDHISPGPVFADYLPPSEDEPVPRPETALKTLEFKSCGYAIFLSHQHGFNQMVIETPPYDPNQDETWFHTRRTALSSSMMPSRQENHFAEIIQHMPQRELDALLLGWGLTHGWADHEKAFEVRYDGCLAGGTGRFSGIIEKGMPLIGQPPPVRGPQVGQPVTEHPAPSAQQQQFNGQPPVVGHQSDGHPIPGQHFTGQPPLGEPHLVEQPTLAQMLGEQQFNGPQFVEQLFVEQLFPVGGHPPPAPIPSPQSGPSATAPHRTFPVPGQPSVTLEQFIARHVGDPPRPRTQSRNRARR